MYNKETFLKTGIVIDNEYFEKYINLIERNELTKQEKGKTHCHHIIPKYCFASSTCINDLEQESEENKVNLLYKDHVLAHYYLSLCSSTNRYKINNIYALKYLLGINSFLLKNSSFTDKLEFLQDLYEFCKNNTDYSFTKNINLNKIWMNFNGRNYRILKENAEYCLSIGYNIGHTFKTNTGKIWITNGEFEKLILSTDIKLYESLGYYRGRLPFSEELKKKLKDSSKHSGTTTGKICINNGKQNKFIYENDLNTFLNSGWSVGSKPVKRIKPKHYKIKDSSIKRLWVNKDKKNFKINKSLIQDYLNNGYSVGRYIENKEIFNSGKNFIWMTRDGKNKRVHINDENLYKLDGWMRGRNTENIIKKRKENNKPCKKGQNKGGKYLYKDGIKKHFYGDDIEKMLEDGWVTNEQRKKL